MAKSIALWADKDWDKTPGLVVNLNRLICSEDDRRIAAVEIPDDCPEKPFSFDCRQGAIECFERGCHFVIPYFDDDEKTLIAAYVAPACPYLETEDSK